MKIEPQPSDRQVLAGLVERVTYQNATAGFRKMVARLGAAAKFKLPVHPHMFRHAAGYKLGNAGHDTRALQAYLGHKNIQHVRYTELASDRFRDFWRD